MSKDKEIHGPPGPKPDPPPDPPPAKRVAMKKAWVTPAGSTTEVEVEYPADAPDPDAAAIEAYQQMCGIWALPEQPSVRHK